MGLQEVYGKCTIVRQSFQGDNLTTDNEFILQYLARRFRQRRPIRWPACPGNKGVCYLVDAYLDFAENMAIRITEPGLSVFYPR